MNKICKECKIEKEVSFFYKNNGRSGISEYRTTCKECAKSNSKIHKMKNKEYHKEYHRKYHKDNKEELNIYCKQWRDENKEKIKEQRRLHYKENKEKIVKRNYEYHKKRMKDPLFKLTRSIRSLILISFKGKFTEKSKKTTEILGCNFQEFKIYLESKFDENMTWENHGTYWHIDHIKPISLAKNKKEVYDLNHYSNFQPLYWKDNLSKGNKYDI